MVNIHPIEAGVKRPYRSPRREAQAKQTRTAILDAAQALFVADGYGATSIKAIAERAYVAEPTVYAVFGDKPSIASTLLERAVSGTDERQAAIATMLERLTDEPKLNQRVRLATHFLREEFERGLPDLLDAIFQGAATDPRLAEVVEEAQDRSYQETKLITELVLGEEDLGGVNRTRYVDAVWAVTSSYTYRRLTERQGWTGEEYEEWITRMIEAIPHTLR